MLATTVGTIPLKCCIYNASGPRTGSTEALVKIARSHAGAVLSKSATLCKQSGNDMPRFINQVDLGPNYSQGSINSEGLPNLGIDYYISEEAVSALKNYDKPYIISLSGLKLSDNILMLEKVLNVDGISGIELNLACPNIPGKPIIGYDFDQMDVVLSTVVNTPEFGRYPLGVKLPPYFDISHFRKSAEIISKYRVSYVVAINTVGNALFVDMETESEAFAANSGLGGLGGGFVKHTALANVRMLCKCFTELNRPDIDVVGVGGVHSGRDAFELILCGAKAVQVGTCHWTEGPACFDRIATELQGIMTKKGYNSLEDFRGKLKPYVKSGAAAKGSSSSSSSSSSKETKQSVLSPLPVAGSVGYLVGVVLYSILVAIFAIVAARYTGIVGV